MANNFSFPLLAKEEIKLCLQELNIPCSDEDLTSPKEGTVKLFFSKMIEMLLNKRPEDLEAQHFAVTEMDHPELHETSIPTIAFLNTCERLLRTCGITDFSLKDLTAPTKQRLRSQISAIINFAKFREEQLPKYQNFTQETDQLTQDKQVLEDENEQLLTELNELKRARQQEAPEVERLTSENAEREVRIKAIWNQQTELQQECQTVKAQLQQVKDELKVTEFQVTALLPLPPPHTPVCASSVVRVVAWRRLSATALVGMRFFTPSAARFVSASRQVPHLARTDRPLTCPTIRCAHSCWRRRRRASGWRGRSSTTRRS